MTLKYKLLESDFLFLTLYLAKKDGLLKNAILRDTLIWAIIALAFIILLYFDHGLFTAIVTLIAVTIGLIIRPFRLKGIYFKRCEKQAKLFQSSFNCGYEFELGDKYVDVKSENVEVKRSLSEIKSIIETSNHFFILFNIGNIIIPKLGFHNIEAIRNGLVSLSQKIKGTYISDLTWKW
jgi:hypothetical protein